MVKKLSALLQRITSKHKGNLFCLSCLYSFRTENLMRVNFMKNNFKIKLFGELQCHPKRTVYYNLINIWSQIKYIVYADLEFLIKKQMDVQTIQKNLQQKNYVNLIPENIQCQTIWAFDNIENKHSLHRWEDCMKKFCTY